MPRTDPTRPAADRPATRAAARAEGAGLPQLTLRAVLPWVLAVVAALLWWPVGFAGTADGELPLDPARGWQLLLGGFAAAAVVGLLVREAWVRFGIVVGLSALGVLGAGGSRTGGETGVLLGLLAAGTLLGLAVGVRGARGSSPAAAALALAAGLTPSSLPTGALLAVALALPAWTATRERVAPTVAAVVRVLLLWLVGVIVRAGLAAGWAVAARGGPLGSPSALRRVGPPAADRVRTGWAGLAGDALVAARPWLAVAAGLALLLVAVRAVRARRLAHQ